MTLTTATITLNSAFKTPRNYGVDHLICLLNEVRFECTYTTSPMIVTIDLTSNSFVSISKNRLSISTEYVSPYDGIVHPNTEGLYDITVTLKDASGNQNTATRWL